MVFDIIDPGIFLENDFFNEDIFIKKTTAYDWSKFQGKKVLVRGCNSALMPPWAFMLITGKLILYAQSVRYGNEHDNIIVYKKMK